ncbi:Tiparp, partial [Symbiodinium microadriaticum]
MCVGSRAVAVAPYVATSVGMYSHVDEFHGCRSTEKAPLLLLLVVVIIIVMTVKLWHVPCTMVKGEGFLGFQITSATMDVDYELSQQLQGHESQVRCVAVLGDGTLVSGGLDSQVILWRRQGDAEKFEMVKKLGWHSDFVFVVAPSHTESGSFYSGSK